MIWRRLVSFKFLAVFVLLTSLSQELRAESADVHGATEAAPSGWLGLGLCYHEEDGGPGGPQGWLSVEGVLPGGSAALAGLKRGDVISQIDGEEFRFENDFHLLSFFAALVPGEEVAFTVLRGHSKEIVTLEVEEMPGEYLESWRLRFLAAEEASRESRTSP